MRTFGCGWECTRFILAKEVDWKFIVFVQQLIVVPVGKCMPLETKMHMNCIEIARLS